MSREGAIVARFTRGADGRAEFRFDGQARDVVLRWKKGCYWMENARRPLSEAEAKRFRKAAQAAVSEWAWAHLQATARRIDELGVHEWRRQVRETLKVVSIIHFAIENGGLDPDHVLSPDDKRECQIQLTARLWADCKYLDDLAEQRADLFTGSGAAPELVPLVGLLLEADVVKYSPYHGQQRKTFENSLRAQQARG